MPFFGNSSPRKTQLPITRRPLPPNAQIPPHLIQPPKQAIDSFKPKENPPQSLRLRTVDAQRPRGRLQQGNPLEAPQSAELCSPCSPQPPIYPQQSFRRLGSRTTSSRNFQQRPAAPSSIRRIPTILQAGHPRRSSPPAVTMQHANYASPVSQSILSRPSSFFQSSQAPRSYRAPYPDQGHDHKDLALFKPMPAYDIKEFTASPVSDASGEFSPLPRSKRSSWVKGDDNTIAL
jgi:hypothetical protein